MKEQLICAQTEHMTKVSLCDQINMSQLKSNQEQVNHNDSAA